MNMQSVKNNVNSIRPKKFRLYELLPPEIYRSEDQGWELLSEKFLITLDVIRDIIDAPMICNTWYQGGNRRYCGLRPANCKTGAKNSRHKYGDAGDFLSPNYTAEEMRQKIIANQHLLPYPIRIEADVDWLLFDCKDMDYKGKKIYLFKA